jgi:hypothetical protein
MLDARSVKRATEALLGRGPVSSKFALRILGEAVRLTVVVVCSLFRPGDC